MNPLPSEWAPLPVAGLSAELAGFDGWMLCGGYSVARVVGEDTRTHGDLDVGVFRSELPDCLRIFERERVFLCRNRAHAVWDGGTVPQEVHDIWIADRERRFWLFQILIFDDQGDTVIYRRDPRIRWSKRHHSLLIGEMRVLNPFVTFLFKAHQTVHEEKDIHDVIALIEGGLK